jgi:hypothetical protein
VAVLGAVVVIGLPAQGSLSQVELLVVATETVMHLVHLSSPTLVSVEVLTLYHATPNLSPRHPPELQHLQLLSTRFINLLLRSEVLLQLEADRLLLKTA